MYIKRGILTNFKKSDKIIDNNKYSKKMKKLLLTTLLFISLFSQAHAADNPFDVFKNFVDDKKNEVSTYISDLKKWAIDWVENYVIDIVEPQLESKKQEIISDINSKIDNQKIELEKKSDELKKQLEENKNELYSVRDEIVSWKSVWKIIFNYIVAIVSFIILLQVIFITFKFVAKLILFYTINKSKYIHLQDKNYTAKINIKKSIEVKINNDFFIKNNSILKYWNTSLSIWFPFWIFNLFAYFKWVYLCNKVSKGSITITSPNHFSYLTEVIVPKWWIFVFNLANLLAFEKWIKIKTKWNLSVWWILEKKFRFHYIEWPAKLYMYGVWEVVFEKISWDTSFEDNTVIWFSWSLKRNISIVENFWLYIINKNSIKEHFFWDWYIIRQKIWVTDSQLRKLNKNNWWWFSFVSDVVGLIK